MCVCVCVYKSFAYTFPHSGAGKTVSATHIMRYFATADDEESGKVKDVSQGMTEVEKQIMGKPSNFSFVILYAKPFFGVTLF